MIINENIQFNRRSCVYSGSIWGIPGRTTNMLMRFDFETALCEAQVVCQGLAAHCVCVDENVVALVPVRNGEKLIIINRKTNEIKSFQIPQKNIKGRTFLFSAIYGKSIYMFGQRYPGILIYNLDTGMLEEHPYDKMIKNWEKIKQNLIIADYLVEEENAYLLMHRLPYLIHFSMKDRKYRKVQALGDGTEYFTCMYIEDSECWLVNNRQELVRWDMCLNVVINRMKLPYLKDVPVDAEYSLYNRMFKVGHSLFIVPCKSPYLIRYDLKKGEFIIEKIHSPFGLSERRRYGFAGIYKDQLYLQDSETGVISRFTENMECKEIHMAVSITDTIGGLPERSGCFPLKEREKTDVGAKIWETLR